MPSRTFLVAISTDTIDPFSLSELALDIESDLIHSGHDVESVKPWAIPINPQASPAGGFLPLTNPTEPNQIL